MTSVFVGSTTPLCINANQYHVVFLNHSELVPEYAYHDDNFVPILFLRKIVGLRVTPGGGPGLLTRWHGDRTVNGNKNSATATTKEWDSCSLYYRFRSLQDMLNFQFVLLGEAVKTDMYVFFQCPICIMFVYVIACFVSRLTDEHIGIL